MSEVYALTSAKNEAVSFADVDSKFGFGVWNNPQQFGKTSEQLQNQANDLIGRVVSWSGIVTDVRQGQILIAMRTISTTNEVVLIPGWWDSGKAEGINRGAWIEFSGVLSTIGNPYPFGIFDGTIRSSRAISPDEAKSLLLH